VSTPGVGEGWGLRPYRSGDETQLIELFGRVFGRPLPLETWIWKLKGQPTPVENVWVVVAEGDERVIGQYAGIPVRVRLGGKERWVMQSVDTMVSPDFRRRGILTALGKATYQSWADGGVSAVFGVPNQHWGTRTDALGLQPLFPLVWQRIPLRLGRALVRSQWLPRALTAPIAPLADALARGWRAAARFPGGRIGDVQLEAIGRAGGEIDALWHCVGAPYRNAVIRDAAWVNWRYLQAPGFAYRVLLARTGGEPAGYIAYRLAEAGSRRTAIIADLLTAPGARPVAAALLAAALADLLSREAEMALAAAPRSSELQRTLRRAGFLPMRGTSQVLLAPLTPDVNPSSLRSPDGWLLAAGDFDVV
jgi:hypothetical protein